ncbi:hypothetical protein HZS_7310 [Henneguya salminicola]|nr:hypothetical protein HZS_7310 [Henneguya salminicola]
MGNLLSKLLNNNKIIFHLTELLTMYFEDTEVFDSKSSNIGRDWNTFSRTLQSHKILFSPYLSITEQIEKSFKEYFKPIHIIIELFDFYIDEIKQAYCVHQDNLIFENETIYIQSGIFLRQFANKVKKLNDRHLPISFYTKIVEHENITKSLIVSPLKTKEGPLIGVNIFNDRNLKNNFKYSIICHNHLIYERKEIWSFPFTTYTHLIYYRTFWSVVQDLMDTTIIRLKLGKNVRNVKKYIKNGQIYCEEKHV